MPITLSQVGLILISLSLFGPASGQICPRQITSGDMTSSVEFCCEGYREVKRTLERLICEPICEPACGHGKCSFPNSCACDKGYILSISGTCMSEEYFKLNSPKTNDGNCQTGYRTTPEGNCEPVCNRECVNARCLEPNHCHCFEGYVLDMETNECVATCNGKKINGCMGGTCVDYDKCRCDNGTVLLMNNKFECIGKREAKSLARNEQILNGKWYILIALVVAVFLAVISYVAYVQFKKRRSALEIAGDY